MVTLGIIGVVSAMTLPTLVKNHQRQVYVTQLHKVVNELSQAVEQAITDSNAVHLGESSIARTGTQNFMRNYFKTAKICTGNSVRECFADSYKNMNGADIRLRSFIVSSGGAHNDGEVNVSGVAMVTASGASIYMVPDGTYNLGLYIVTDVNGKQGPNILGRDFFDFTIDRNGSINAGDIDDIASDFSTNCSSATDVGQYGGCIAKILNDGWKMDY